MTDDPLVEIGPGLSVPQSRLARTLWPGLVSSREDVLACLEQVSPEELLRQYRAHFDPPDYIGDWSPVERATRDWLMLSRAAR